MKTGVSYRDRAKMSQEIMVKVRQIANVDSIFYRIFLGPSEGYSVLCFKTVFSFFPTITEGGRWVWLESVLKYRYQGTYHKYTDYICLDEANDELRNWLKENRI